MEVGWVEWVGVRAQTGYMYGRPLAPSLTVMRIQETQNRLAVRPLARREDDHLENFDEEDEDADLTEFITETIMDNVWEYDFIERDVTKYDHKRGWVDMSFSLSVPWGVLKESNEFFGSDWKASTRTKKNTRVSVGE